MLNLHGPESQEALADLCRTYWYPLYAYVRRRVSDVHRAQDLTQAFFAQLLEKETMLRASPERGRFRGLLLTSLKNFLSNEYDRENALKRGGGRTILSLDFDSGEQRITHEPAHDLTPELLFEQQWALMVLERAMDALRAEYDADGKRDVFDVLRDTITADRTRVDYSVIADRLDRSVDATRQAASRLKKRYRAVLRAEVCRTIADPDEVESEIRALFSTFSG